MEEAEEDNVDHEVVPQDSADQTTPKEEQKQPPVDDYKERNWKAARQRMAELEKQNRDKDELIKRALDMQQAYQQPHKVAVEAEEPDDEFIPRGKVKHLAKKQMEPLEKKIEELEILLKNQNQRELYNSLKSRYRDFDEVVNQESLALLEENDPELAQTIVEMKDPYKMGIQTYKYIKALGISVESSEKRHAKEAEKKLEKNAKTIQSPLAYDKRPMAQAFRMTETERSKLWEEMNHFGSMANSVPNL